MATNGIAEGFTQDELAQIEAMLVERRRLLLNDVQALEEEEAQDASDLSPFSTHLADLGSDRASSDVSLGCRASASSEIQEIDEALERIHDGSFGLCETCEKPIAKGRLEAIPYARLCLPCKAAEES
jgi:RNA polymerase-binding transcription factor DksA